MTMAQKPDTAEVEVGEAITSSLTEIRKKVRNLEKKKTKLDTLRDDVKKSGKPLNEDQAQALARYDDITQQLETFRELNKQLETCSVDVEKAYKRFLKKQESSEMDRLVTLEKYRAVARVLDSTEGIKQLIDKNEALINEVDLQTLNALRKILFPLHSDFTSSSKFQSFDEFLKHIAEQQLNLAAGRTVQFLDEPIPQAKELLDRLVGSQYFVQQTALLFARPSQKPSMPVQDRSRSSTMSSQHTGQTPSATHPSVAVLQKEHGDVHSKSPVFLSTGSISGGFAAHQTKVPSVNDHGVNAQTGLPVSSASGPANHSITSPSSSYSVPTQPVDVMQNIDHFSPESVKSSNQRRDSLNQHPNQVSKEAAWQSVPANGRVPLEGSSGDNTPKTFQNVDNGNGNCDQRVPRQNGNRYRDDNRPGNSGMNEGMRGRGRGYYGNNQDRRQYAYPGGERRPDEAGENGRKDGELDYRPEKERGGTSGDRYNGRENRPSYANGPDHDGSGDKDSNDNDFGVFHVDNPHYKGRTGIPGEDRRGGRRGTGQGYRGGPSNGNYGYGRNTH